MEEITYKGHKELERGDLKTESKRTRILKAVQSFLFRAILKEGEACKGNVVREVRKNLEDVSNAALNLPPLPKIYHKQCFSITDSQSKGRFL